MRYVLLRLVGWVVLAAVASGAAAADADLAARAVALGLHTRPMWSALLHLSGASQSYVDGDSFFLTSRKERDLPERELIATVRELFVVGNTQAQCRFVARYFWLSEQLFGEGRFPECSDFAQWLAGIDPAGLTLVFADAFPNNPASMFGHTFLRVDAHSKMPLLAYGIQYGADAAADPGLLYAMKGIFGGYQGFFTVMPYYKSVQQYGNIEDRDLWEYQLSYQPNHVRFLLAHLWELRGIPFDYFYFDENCSFHLLTLLDILRPEDPFSKKLLPWVIPMDALKIISDTPGLVTTVARRLSQASAMRQKLSAISAEDRRTVAALGRGRLLASDGAVGKLPEERRAIVLEAAYDYVSYLEARGDVATADRPQRLYDLLSARSKVAVVANPLSEPVFRPEGGHDSRRVSWGGGIHSRRGGFATMQFRGAYHSIDDNQAGYVPGLEIALLETELRQFARQLRLQSVEVARVLSIFPNDSLIRKVSWGARLGWSPPLLHRGDGLVSGLEVGMGYGVRFGTHGLLYGMGSLRGEAGGGPAHLGLGAVGGSVLELSEKVRFLAGVRLFGRFRGVSADVRYGLTDCDALKLGVKREFPFGERGTTVSLAWQRYF